MIAISPLSKLEAGTFINSKVVKASRSIWEMRIDGSLVMVAGVAQESMLGEAELWLMKGPYFNQYKRLTLRNVKNLMRWLLTQYPRVMARAEPDSERLAEYCGMKYIGWDEWPDGRRWKKYEATQ